MPAVAYVPSSSVGIAISPAPGGSASLERIRPDGQVDVWQELVTRFSSKIIVVAAQRRAVMEQPRPVAWNPTLPWDGQGFKAWLNDLEGGRSKSDQGRFESFQQDIQQVAGMERLRLRAHTSEHNLDVLVDDDGGFRASVEDCGTGLQTVILVLSALHRTRGSIVLIDDPEAHLHPAAQATFARVVAARARSSGGQVIFATHSPAVLDAVPDDQVFEVTRTNGSSQVRRLAKNTSVLDSIRSLGYRPSLLKMADTVLFLEGPHDQAAVRSWWKTLFGEEPEPRVALLVAGGDCMRHLQKEALRALGRRCFALFDSDRIAKEAAPKDVAVEFRTRMSGVVRTHILRRREIENYYSPRAVQAVLRLKNQPVFGPYADVPLVVTGFSKGRAGELAAAMSVNEIPTEITNFLQSVHG
jgi:hypothetical protein